MLWLSLAAEVEEEDVQSESETDGSEQETETTPLESLNINDDILTLDAILATESDVDDYQFSQTCVDSFDARTYDILSNRFIALESRRSEDILLIQFEDPCIGLNRGSTLMFERETSGFGKLCEHDKVRVLSTGSVVTGLTESGFCRVPEIQQITPVQLDQLRRGLNSERVE